MINSEAKKAIYKVPNGKLLKIFLKDDGAQITELKITGDFFVYPEEQVEALEGALIGVALNDEALRNGIESFIQTHSVTLFGVDVESLVLTILKAHDS